jgi:hypothetical protein
LALDPATGASNELLTLQTSIVDVAPDGDRLITGQGELYRLTDARLLSRLPFPTTIPSSD